MHENIQIRPILPEERGVFVQWLHENRDNNRYDPEIYRKGQVDIYVAYDSTGPLYFIPFRNVWCWDSLAPRPDISPLRAALCLEKFQEFFTARAKEANVGEMIFRASEASLPEIAEKHGWKRVESMYSLNVNKAGT